MMNTHPETTPEIQTSFLSSRSMRAIARLLIVVQLAQPTLGLAQVTPANKSTQVIPTQVDVPVVNIATPSAAGVSHNRYQDYNVGPKGLILNNATARAQDTQLIGYIPGNPNLQGRPAKIILNEVTGSQRTQLRGPTEVAGARAHVIVANPHGITCDGCGFINTPRVTLSTGLPVLDEGRLSHYDVQRGDILIEGRGLDGSRVDRFELIARSAQINAALVARQLDIVLGSNRVEADSLAATSQPGEGPAPRLAIDSAALGGMYANAIHLVSTEQGVGVNLAGAFAASTGAATIRADGQLTLNAPVSAAQGDVHLYLPQGALTSGPEGRLYAGGTVHLHGGLTLGADQSLQVFAQTIAVAHALDNQGALQLSGTLTTPTLTNSGTIDGQGLLVLEADEAHNTGSIQGEYLGLSIARDFYSPGTLHGEHWLSVNVGQEFDARGATLTSGSDKTAGDLLLRVGGTARLEQSTIRTGTLKGADTNAKAQAAAAEAPAFGDTGRITLVANDARLDGATLAAQTDLVGLILNDLSASGGVQLASGGAQFWVSGNALAFERPNLEVGSQLGLLAGGDLTLDAQTVQSSLTQQLPGEPAPFRFLPPLPGPTQITEETTQHGPTLLVSGSAFLGSGQQELAQSLLGEGLLPPPSAGHFTDGRLAAASLGLLDALLAPVQKSAAASAPPPEAQAQAAAPQGRGDLRIQGGQFDIGGDLIVHANGKIDIEALRDRQRITTAYAPRVLPQEDVRGPTYADFPLTYAEYTSTERQTEHAHGLTARLGGTLTLHGTDDVVLQAVALHIGGELNLSSAARLSLEAATQTDFERRDQVVLSDTALWQTRLQAGDSLTMLRERSPSSHEVILAASRALTTLPGPPRGEGSSHYDARTAVLGNTLAAQGRINLAAGGLLDLNSVEITAPELGLAGALLNIAGTAGGTEQRTHTAQWEPYNCLSDVGCQDKLTRRSTQASGQDYWGSTIKVPGQVNLVGLGITHEGERLLPGDINLLGSRIEAGTVHVQAEGKLNLLAAQSTTGGAGIERALHTPSLIQAGQLTGTVAGDVTLYGSRIRADVGTHAQPFHVQGNWTDIAAVDDTKTLPPPLLGIFWLKTPQSITSELVASGITGSGHVRIEGDATFAGSRYEGKQLYIDVGGDLLAVPVRLTERTHRGKVSDHNRSRDTTRVTSVVASFVTEEDLTLRAGGRFDGEGGYYFSEQGDVWLGGEKGLQILAAYDSLHVERKTKSHVYTEQDIYVVSPVFEAPRGRVTFHSGTDIALESIQLQTQLDPQLEVPGPRVVFERGSTLRLNVAHASRTTTESKTRDSGLWIVITNKGVSRSWAINNQIGTDQVDWGTGPIQVQYAQSVSDTLNYGLAELKNPGSRNRAQEAVNSYGADQLWVHELAARWAAGEAIDWQAQQTGYDDWDHGYNGLSEFGAVVVAVVVTALTWGAAAKPMAAAMGPTMGAIAAATTAAVASSVVVQLGTTHEIDWNQTFKAALVAAVTAGLTNGLFFEGGTASLNSMAGLSSAPGAASSGLTFSTDQLLGLLGRSVVSAGVQNLVYGTDFGEAFVNSVVTDFAALGARSIGLQWSAKGVEPNIGLHVLAHAGLGATAAWLTGRDPVAGALGGLTEAVLDNLTHELFPNYSAALQLEKNYGQRALYTGGTMLLSGLIAESVGHEPVVAAQAAQNAAQNNKFIYACKDEQQCEKLDRGMKRVETMLKQAANSDGASDETRNTYANFMRLKNDQDYVVILERSYDRNDYDMFEQKIKWNPDLFTGGVDAAGSSSNLPEVRLAHEIGHALDQYFAFHFSHNIPEPIPSGFLDPKKPNVSVGKKEMYAVSFENIIRGVLYPNDPLALRKDYISPFPFYTDEDISKVREIEMYKALLDPATLKSSGKLDMYVDPSGEPVKLDYSKSPPVPIRNNTWSNERIPLPWQYR